MKRIVLYFGLWMMVLLMFTACSEQNEANTETPDETTNETNEEPNQPEEVTLIWATENQGRYEPAKEAIEEKFPHITIEFYNTPSTREAIQEMLAAQVHPDIFDTFNAYKLPLYMEAQLTYDMDELVESHGFDLDRIEPNILKRIRSYALNQELYAFPYEPDLLALFYNKDIFDLFGVEYPYDGITWDEVLDLARELTVFYEGTQYYGLEIWNPFFPGEAYDITYVDPDTDEPIFSQSPGLRAGFEVY